MSVGSLRRSQLRASGDWLFVNPLRTHARTAQHDTNSLQQLTSSASSLMTETRTLSTLASSARRSLAAAGALCLEMEELEVPSVQLRDRLTAVLPVVIEIEEETLLADLECVLHDFLALLARHRVRSRLMRRMRQRQVVDDLSELNARLNRIVSDVTESEAWKTGSVHLSAAGLLDSRSGLHTSSTANSMSCWDPSLIAAFAEIARNGSPRDRTRVARIVYRVTSQDEEKTAAFVKAGGVSVLVALTVMGSAEEKQRAARALRRVAWRVAISEEIAETDGIVSILRLAHKGTQGQQEEALAALWNLAYKELANSIKIAEAGGIDILKVVLTTSSGLRKERAIGALRELAREPTCRVAIGKASVIKILVEIAQNGETGQKTHATGALWTLAYQNPDNRIKIVSAGGVEVVLSLLRTGNKVQRENAMGVLRNMSPTPGIQSRIHEAGGIAAIVHAIQTGSKLQQRRGVATLCNIALDSKENQVAIVEAGGVDILLRLIREEEGESVLDAIGTLNKVAGVPSSESSFANMGAITTILGLVTNGCDVQKEVAAHTCWRLCHAHPAIIKLIHGAGGVKIFIDLAREGTEKQKDSAVGTLGKLTLDQAAADEICREGGVEVLTECLRDGSDVQKKIGGAALWILSISSEERQSKIRTWRSLHSTEKLPTNVPTSNGQTYYAQSTQAV